MPSLKVSFPSVAAMSAKWHEHPATKMFGFRALQHEAIELLQPIIEFVLSTLRLTAFIHGTEPFWNFSCMTLKKKNSSFSTVFSTCGTHVRKMTCDLFGSVHIIYANGNRINFVHSCII